MNFEIFSQVTRVTKDSSSKAVLTEYADAKLKIVERISKGIKEHNKITKEQKVEPKHVEAHMEKEFLEKYIDSDTESDQCTLRTPTTPMRGTKTASYVSSNKG